MRVGRSKSCGCARKRNAKGRSKEPRKAFYQTYAGRLNVFEEVRKDPENENLLQVKCAQCREWFTPNANQVNRRLAAFNGTGIGENRFYCSDSCKKACPVYKQIKYPKGDKPYDQPREVQAELRTLVLKRDNYECQICGRKNKLRCHHVEPVALNPIESADIDVCITLCEDCHKRVHSEAGCTNHDLSKCA